MENFRRIGAPKALASTAARVFELVKVAEEELEAAKKRHPGKAPEVHRAFRLIEPGGLLWLDDEVFRAHARELIQRVVDGKDTRLGTRAEVIAALSEASLRAPLPRDETELMAKIATRIFPEKKKEFGYRKNHESYKGSTDELLRKFRKQLLKPDRRHQ